MKDIKDLVQKSAREIAASSKTSPTEAGRTERDYRRDDELIDTINQIFSLFRINYHNQYHAAFGDTVLLNQAKRLWKESLGHFSREQILRAARQVIEESDYLPTLNKMLTACEHDLREYNVPDVRTAYLEAANKPSPKNAQQWSHPIVYHAGKTIGWYALSHLSEHITFPAFEKAYRQLIKRVLEGEQFDIDRTSMIEAKRSPKPARETIERELQELRDLLS